MQTESYRFTRCGAKKSSGGVNRRGPVFRDRIFSEQQRKLASFSRARLLGMHQRSVDQMLAQEPYLEFVGA
jgi:hypothetical protein